MPAQRPKKRASNEETVGRQPEITFQECAGKFQSSSNPNDVELGESEGQWNRQFATRAEQARRRAVGRFSITRRPGGAVSLNAADLRGSRLEIDTRGRRGAGQSHTLDPKC